MSLSRLQAYERNLTTKKEDDGDQKEFKFHIGFNRFVVISNNGTYINVSFREFKKFPNGEKLYATKNGVSLTLRQYDTLVVAQSDLSDSMQDKMFNFGTSEILDLNKDARAWVQSKRDAYDGQPRLYIGKRFKQDVEEKRFMLSKLQFDRWLTRKEDIEAKVAEMLAHVAEIKSRQPSENNMMDVDTDNPSVMESMDNEMLGLTCNGGSGGGGDENKPPTTNTATNVMTIAEAAVETSLSVCRFKQLYILVSAVCLRRLCKTNLRCDACDIDDLSQHHHDCMMLDEAERVQMISSQESKKLFLHAKEIGTVYGRLLVHMPFEFFHKQNYQATMEKVDEFASEFLHTDSGCWRICEKCDDIGWDRIDDQEEKERIAFIDTLFNVMEH